MKKLLFILIVAFAVVSASFAAEVKPMAMKNSAVGGAALNVYTPGVEGGEGVNNVGLLIRTWGKVTAVDAEHSVLFISDGTARVVGSGNTGLRVRLDSLAEGVTITPPAVGSFVAITAISSTAVADGKIYSCLRPRSQDDIIVF
ncbi:MAG: hypothetical protein J6X53_07145 [Abditibacteriota bacterium]|nr:hypothetical protein [Abditibacteriota bacterium]